MATRPVRPPRPTAIQQQPPTPPKVKKPSVASWWRSLQSKEEPEEVKPQKPESEVESLFWLFSTQPPEQPIPAKPHVWDNLFLSSIFEESEAAQVKANINWWSSLKDKPEETTWGAAIGTTSASSSNPKWEIPEPTWGSLIGEQPQPTEKLSWATDKRHVQGLPPDAAKQNISWWNTLKDRVRSTRQVSSDGVTWTTNYLDPTATRERWVVEKLDPVTKQWRIDSVEMEDRQISYRFYSIDHNERFNTDLLGFVITSRITNANQAQEAVQAAIQDIIASYELDNRDQLQLKMIPHDMENLHPISTPMVSIDSVNTLFQRLTSFMEEEYAERPADIDECDFVLYVFRGPRGGNRTKALTYEMLTKKRCYLEVKNKDNTCMARSIVLLLNHTKKEKGEITDNQWKYVRDASRGVQIQEAITLCKAAGVDPSKMAGTEEVKKFEAHLNASISIVKDLNFEFVYKAKYEPNKPNYYIHLMDKHYNAITDMGKLHGAKHWCHACKKPYETTHTCVADLDCKDCGCSHEKNLQELRTMYCKECNMTYFPSCFEHHKKYVCKKFMYCNTCKARVKRMNSKDKPHNCHMKTCNFCGVEFKKFTDHKCFMEPTKPRKPIEKFIFFDIESKLFDIPYDSLPQGTQLPNCICAQYNDGSKFHFDTIEAFTSWLFTDHRGYTVVAHNGKGYDFHFVLKYLLEHKLVTKMDKYIPKGMNIMAYYSKEANIRFIDSHNFIAAPLKSFTETFQLTSKKGEFPVFFNRPRSQGYLGPIPDKKFFSTKKFSEKEMKEFDTWYATKVMPAAKEEEYWNFLSQKTKFPVPTLKEFQWLSWAKWASPYAQPPEATPEYKEWLQKSSDYLQDIVRKWYKEQNLEPYDLRKEMIDYCDDDVTLLREGVNKYRKSSMEREPLDPFCYMTLAEYRSNAFRQLYLPKDKIGIIRKTHKDIYSLRACIWLEDLNAQGHKIKHALNGGEKSITTAKHTYFVDGYEEIPGNEFYSTRKIVYEFNGCLFHGCPKCFEGRGEEFCKRIQSKFSKAYERTKNREAELRANGYEVVTMWEHDHKKILSDVQLKQRAKQMVECSQLVPRDALYGGRTEVFRMYVNQLFKYFDVCSMYPSVNYYDMYPVGHPIRVIAPKDYTPGKITLEKGYLKEYEPGNYFGVMKCKILPPKQLFIPVLPEHVDGKMLFHLCSQCARLKEPKCTHTDDERALIGAWGTPEIDLAIARGYKLLKVYEIHQFEEKSRDMFKAYIAACWQLKQEASGCPPEKMQQYITDNKELFGFEMKPEDVKKNPALRAIAKFNVNTLWGKWGQREDLEQHVFLRDASDFEKAKGDNTKVDKKFMLITPDIMEERFRENQADSSKCTNVYLALFTTTWARIRLYAGLEFAGKDLMYSDTDSFMMVYSDNKQLFTKNQLGCWVDEFEDKHGCSFGTEYAGLGPKTYGVRDEKNKIELRAKGFTQDRETSKVITFENLKKELFNPAEKGKQLTVDTHLIKKDTKHNVSSYSGKKILKYSFDKRMVVGEVFPHLEKYKYYTLPWGYQGEPNFE
jgi:hypothetical protein